MENFIAGRIEITRETRPAHLGFRIAMLYSRVSIEKALMSPSEKPKNKRLRVVRSDQAAPAPAADPTSAAEPSCPHCYGTGMEVVPGEGARRCRCQSFDDRERLLHAARIPRRYHKCTLANYEAGESDSMWK